MKFKFKMFHIWFVVPVMIIALWVFIFYMPFSAKIKQKEKEISNLKQEEQGIEVNIRTAIDLKKRNEQAKSSIIEIQMQLPTIDAFPDFMIGLLKDIKKDAASLSSFSTNFSSLEGEPGLLLIHPVFEIGLKGKYVNIGKLLNDLGNRKFYRGISKAKISYDEIEYPALTGKFAVEFTARRSGVLEDK
ncbi:MAG: hypothetical protein NTX36_06945 [Proteobacteria bacterium]|nr:hypothetical protein [Pseudomonadota bacterium]